MSGRRPAPAVLALTVLLGLVSSCTSSDDKETADTTRTTEPTSTTTTAPPIWTGPELDRGTVVHAMTKAPEDPATSDPDISVFTSADPDDAAVDFVDATGLRFHREDHRWYFELNGTPPGVMSIEPGTVLTYGVAFDTDADGVADYTAGLNNDAPTRGDYRAWSTNVGTGETIEQVGPPYGYPIEFLDFGSPPNGVLLWFLSGTSRAVPPGLDTETAPFFVWTSLTRDGVLVANDYLPDSGWLSGR